VKLPKIAALDLRPLEIIVAEHNAKPSVLKLRIWRRDEFERSMV
jgi:hypothetical protein